MADEWIAVLGSVIVAALAFLFGRVNLARATRLQREEELRQRRMEVYAAFCVSVIEYRRAQLHRWFVGVDLGGSAVAVEEQRPEVADDVRMRRAAAWGCFYEVLMICNDDELVRRAEEALRLTRSMKLMKDPTSLERRSDEVHDAVRSFAVQAGTTVQETNPRAAAPPSGWTGERVPANGPTDEDAS